MTFISIFFNAKSAKIFLLQTVFKFAKALALSEEIFICFTLNQTTVN